MSLKSVFNCLSLCCFYNMLENTMLKQHHYSFKKLNQNKSKALSSTITCMFLSNAIVYCNYFKTFFYFNLSNQLCFSYFKTKVQFSLQKLSNIIICYSQVNSPFSLLKQFSPVPATTM